MVWTKSQDIAIDTEGASRVTSFTLEDLRVQVYGDVAVVTGRIAMKGTLQGEYSEGRSRFTDVFVKRDGRWQWRITRQPLARASNRPANTVVGVPP